MPSPPEAVTGCTPETVCPTVNVRVAVVAVVTSGGGSFTIISVVLVLVFESLSLAVIKYVVSVLVDDGVPDILPVNVSKDKPDGSVGSILKVVPPLPPADITGVNGVIVLLLINVEVVITCVVDIGT